MCKRRRGILAAGKAARSEHPLFAAAESAKPIWAVVFPTKNLNLKIKNYP